MTILDKFRLDGRTAILTDGATVLGTAFARALAEAGADVVLAASDVGALKEAAHIITDAGRRVITLETSLTTPSECTDLVERTVEEFGKVDILVSNAELVAAGDALGTTVNDFQSVIDNNLHRSYWAAQACGRVMLPGSAIVTMSSISGITTTSVPQAAYSASKAALMGLTRDLAQQWGIRKGIRVNTIAGGYFEGAVDVVGCRAPTQHHLKRIVLGRFGDPEEIASTLVWLVSDAGGYVTGQTVVVDGGVTIT